LSLKVEVGTWGNSSTHEVLLQSQQHIGYIETGSRLGELMKPVLKIVTWVTHNQCLLGPLFVLTTTTIFFFFKIALQISKTTIAHLKMTFNISTVVNCSFLFNLFYKTNRS